MAVNTAPAPLDAMALIAGMAQKGEKKRGKSDKPEISNPALDASINQWIDADREVKKFDSIKTTAEAQILAFAVPARLDACRRLGCVESTIRLNGKVSMTAKCQYTAVSMEHVPALREAFGDEADRYFKARTKLSLTDAATEDHDLLNKLVAALGPEKFAAAFTVKQFAEVTENFHHDLTLDSKVEATARPFLDAEIVKAYKPSLRQ